MTFEITRWMLLIIGSLTVNLPQGKSEANRIFYLSVPQEALINVACSLADNAQTLKGWNRVIVEKPFGFDVLSSHRLTQSLLSKFEEKQIYRSLALRLSFLHITLTRMISVVHSRIDSLLFQD